MTLEAMKMEHVHTAGVAGTVSAIDVSEGEQVTTGKIVVEIAAVASLRSVGEAHSDDATILAVRAMMDTLRFAHPDEIYSGRPVPSFSQHAT